MMKKTLLSSIIVLVFCRLAAAASTAGMVEAGNRLYKKQNYTRALKMYEQALLKQPDSALVNYNAGTALYKDKKYKEANSFFEKSLATEDKGLEAKANYNLGNSKYMLGLSREDSDLAGAVQLLEGALNNYKRTLEITPEDHDVKVNYKVVEEKLKELKEKLKHQPPQQKNKGGQKKKQDKKQQQSGQQGQDNKQDQQGQENKQGQEENKQGQEEGKQQEQQNQPGRQGNEQGQAQYGEPEEMSRQEADMLLEGYRSQELPAGMLNDRKKGDERQVLKDW